ncbi:MAG: ATP-binding protein, partial [candidate division KSB1 bacterium]|nr:ATP-binding protein [candidate division KSB1 bacterium]
HGISGDPRRVFEPFYTTKPTGSGLGLTVTQKLVQGHGGWIDVSSTPGKGSTFTLYFPIGDH